MPTSPVGLTELQLEVTPADILRIVELLNASGVTHLLHLYHAKAISHVGNPQFLEYPTSLSRNVKSCINYKTIVVRSSQHSEIMSDSRVITLTSREHVCHVGRRALGYICSNLAPMQLLDLLQSK